MSENENPEKQTGIAIVSSLLNNKASETKELIKNQVIKGEALPAYVGVVLKKFSKVYEEVKKDKELQNLIEEDTKKYREGTAKTFHLYGAKVTIANGRGWMDFSETEDPLLEKLYEIEAIIKEQIKAREDEHKAKLKAWESANTPTGPGFGIKAYTVTWNHLPKLEWEEAAGEVETTPPVKRAGAEQLRYSL